MKVRLKCDVAGVGKEGDTATIKDEYALRMITHGQASLIRRTEPPKTPPKEPKTVRHGKAGEADEP